jgi:hypothetical protein
MEKLGNETCQLQGPEVNSNPRRVTKGEGASIATASGAQLDVQEPRAKFYHLGLLHLARDLAISALLRLASRKTPSASYTVYNIWFGRVKRQYSSTCFPSDAHS